MSAIKVEKKIYLSKIEIVKYQLIHHCFMNNIRLSDTELNCLAFLGSLGSIRLTEFTRRAAEEGILSSNISVNNCLSKIEKSNLFIKKGAGKKIIFLNPILEIKSEGNILIELKLIKVETNTSESNIQKDSKKTEFA